MNAVRQTVKGKGSKVRVDAAGEKKKRFAPLSLATGRRKSAVARVFLRRGNGQVTVNGRPFAQYFDTDVARLAVKIPATVVPALANYDVEVNVSGGGLHGQADAVKLGIARAAVKADPELKSVLRQFGLLTVDDRVKERKKYGKKGARRSFQFVKR
ncbi:MAG: 30S ribosomal protein S9 [Candidatus Babeliaceae bacterium]|nr:30S ribosomal protein S9 [Candidatus Babeliaceae bacterium]